MTIERIGYAFFVGLALLVGFAVRQAESRRIGLPRDLRHAQTAMGGLIGAVVGAKLMMVLYLPLDAWWEVMREMVRLDFDGKTVIGGLTGGYLGVEVSKRIVGITHSTGDAYAVAVPLAHAIGRLGCLWNGCCYGAEAQVPWAILQHGALRHPAQAYELLGNLVIAGVLWTQRRKTRVPGELFKAYVVGYALLRIATDPFRGDAHIPLGPLTFVQVYCLVVALAFAGLIWRGRR